MASVRKIKTTAKDEIQLQLLYGDDSRFKYWESHLFNEVYLRRDLPEKHAKKWDDTESIGFQHFMNILRNLAAEYKDQDKELSSWSETETINKWVRHVLDALGWKNNCTGVQEPYLEETSFRYDGKTYRTDLLIVDHPKEAKYINQAKGDEKLVEARQSVIMPVEVKYWQRLEEYRQGRKEENRRRDNEADDLERTASPNEQIVQYMAILKKNWGMLTDGAKWRLFNSELSSEDSNRFYEFNLFSLIQSINTEETEADRLEVIESGKYFYHFFSKESFFPKHEGEESFVGEILRYSKKYVNRVEEDLKDRFLKAMNIACNGFCRKKGDLKDVENLAIIRNVAESTLFNILFIKSLESRGVLPMNSTDYKKLSLSNMIDKIERFDPDKEDLLNARELERAFQKGNGNSFTYQANGNELHERILRLTEIIHDGNSKKDDFGFEIEGFKESIFSDEEWSFFKKTQLTNQDWVKILFHLGYAESESRTRKYQQIPYSYFTPRQLGSIYEYFLDFKIEVAGEDMVFEARQWKPADLASRKYRSTELPVVKKDSLFFSPNNSERKATGSYYTPDPVVRDLVERSVSPLIKKDSKSISILQLRVCDPTMGSGHFLAGALEYLTAIYVQKLERESKGDLSISLAEAKCEVLEKCIYGYDLNPSAVKLARMSLWLQTAFVGKKLRSLSKKISNKDTLIPKTKKYLEGFSEADDMEFDVIVGNPPWDKLKFDEEEFFKRFADHHSSKSRSKSDKKVDFEKLQRDPDISKKYSYEKSKIEDKIWSVENCYYKFQGNVSESKSRHIDHNLYKLAIERFVRMLKPSGRLGIVVPTGVLGDLGCSGIRKLLLDENTIELIVGFSKDAKIFPISQASCFLVVRKDKGESGFTYVDNLNWDSFGTYKSKLPEMPKISKQVILASDPDTLIIPYFDNATEYQIVEKMYSLAQIDASFLDFGRELHQTDDAKYLTPEKGKVRVIKGDEIDHFFMRKNSKQFLNKKGLDVHERKLANSPRLAIRAISGLTDPRRLVVALIPPSVLTVNSLLVSKMTLSEEERFFYLALMNSRPIEFRFRQVSKNNNVNKFALKQLPLPRFDRNNKSHKKLVELSRKFVLGASSEPATISRIDEISSEIFGLSKMEYKYLNEKIIEARVKDIALEKAA